VLLKFKGDTELKKRGGLWFAVFGRLWGCEMLRLSGSPVSIRNMKATYQVRIVHEFLDS